MKSDKLKGLLILEEPEITELVLHLQEDIAIYEQAVNYGLQPMKQIQQFKDNLIRSKKLYNQIMKALK